MAKNDDGRIRQSIPISGLDTSTPDLTVADGKCEELHNLRYASGAWHDVKPLDIKFQIDTSDPATQLPSNLTIIYHHPAAGDDIYIALIPNDDGTINLCQVAVKDSTLVSQSEGSNPLYIYERTYRVGSLIYNKITVESLKPVATNIAIPIYYTTSRPVSMDILSTTVTIRKGKTSSTEILNACFVKNINTKPTPASDNVYSYPLFMTKEEALVAGGFFATNIPADIHISHFGSMLIIADRSNKQVHYHQLKDNFYTVYLPPSPSILKQSVKRMNLGCKKSYIVTPDGSREYFSRMPIYNTASNTYYPFISTDKAGHWHGEICCFAAFEMNDGAIISPSGMLLFASELDGCTEDDRSYFDYFLEATAHREINSIEYRNDFGDRYDHEFYVKSRVVPDDRNEECYPYGTLNIAILPTIQIIIPEGIDVSLIPRIVIFSTRLNPIYDTEKMQNIARTATHMNARGPMEAGDYADMGMDAVCADNKLPEQPFYKAKTIDLADFKDGEYTLELTYDLLKDIEHNVGYMPTQGLHDIYFNGIKEYNNRMHIYDLQTTLYNGYTQEMIHTCNDSFFESSFYTTIKSEEKQYIAEARQGVSISKFGKLMVYPDWRATQIQIFYDSKQVLSINLVSSVAMNIAYKYNFLGEGEVVKIENAGPRDPKEYTARYVKYPCFRTHPMLAVKPISSNVITEHNRLQISALNNPFSFPFANSYAIGSEDNRIIAVNSAAIEMSDAKFGEFPLYIFTEEGVFALQSGSGDVLYSATIPLNYDRVVNPSTLAVNYNVLYITERGIHAMFSNQSKLISEPLNNRQNHPPLDYLRGAVMCYQRHFNEIIVWNEGQIADGTQRYDSAYVYSLDGGYWSTRGFMGKKLNTEDICVTQSSTETSILDLNTEVLRPGKSVPLRIVSRPIKLGSIEYKRLETLCARLHASAPQPIRILVEGSVDLHTWIPLRDTGFFSTDRDAMIRRFPISVRYLRVTLEANIDVGFELTHLDMEYYMRFVHRLR